MADTTKSRFDSHSIDSSRQKGTAQLRFNKRTDSLECSSMFSFIFFLICSFIFSCFLDERGYSMSLDRASLLSLGPWAPV
jgi:hypothetical protein